MREVTFELPHATLAGYSNDNIDKPLLLALHGWLDNAGSFEPMLPFLDNFHVIALDFPGHGFSKDRSVDAHYHFAEWVYDICVLIELQQWHRLSIVGHSMGGMVAQAVAAMLPETISRIVLIDAVGFITTEPEQAREQLRQAITSRRLADERVKATHPHMASALQARVMAGDVKDSEARILAKRGLVKNHKGYTWRSDSRLRTRSAFRFTFEQAASFIRGVECPVLLIAGRKGAKMVKENLERYQKYFIELRTLDIDGGHHCHMEYPDQAAKLVAEFVGMV